MRLHSAAFYAIDRFNLLSVREDNIEYAYVDGVGVATIGIGVNLRTSTYSDIVLQYLGFDMDGSDLTGDAAIAEAGYVTQLRNANFWTSMISTTTTPRRGRAMSRHKDQRSGHPSFQTLRGVRVTSKREPVARMNTGAGTATPAERTNGGA